MKAKGKAPKSFTVAHPRFRIPGWHELLGPASESEALDMVRHHLITGETGSGKSVSGVMPLLEAILRYPEDEPYAEYVRQVGGKAEARESLRPAILVVDPKQELQSLVEKEAAGRRVRRLAYGEQGPILHMFEGKDLETLDASSAVDLILQQSEFFVQDQARTDDPIWNLQAASLIKDFVAIDMWAMKHGKLHDFWAKIASDLEALGGYKSFAPYLAYKPSNYFKAMATLIAISADGDASTPLAVYLDVCESFEVPGELMPRIVTVMHLANNTRSSVIWMANGILADLASEELSFRKLSANDRALFANDPEDKHPNLNKHKGRATLIVIHSQREIGFSAASATLRSVCSSSWLLGPEIRLQKTRPSLQLNRISDSSARLRSLGGMSHSQIAPGHSRLISGNPAKFANNFRINIRGRF